jgi:fructose-1,6-bisphosphatase/inositol monophosphatase family enzyme
VPDPLVDQVGQLLRHAARTAVLPLFRHLAADDIEEKAPGELVTVADRESERIIEAGLRELLPGSTVVGEEGVAADPQVLDRVGDSGPVWLVDPVDGTTNFAAGRGPFMMMIALLCDGVTRTGWIFDPLADRLMTAERGAGAQVDGVDVHAGTGERPERPRGVVASRYLPMPLRTQVPLRAAELGELLPGQHCAGHEYPAIVTGAQDYTFFWRTLPWDHAAGALFTEEAGGLVRRLDGTAYDPTNHGPHGLLAAASEPVWHQVRSALFP